MVKINLGRKIVKYLLFILIMCSSHELYSQSKKEQIEILMIRVDSLKQAHLNTQHELATQVSKVTELTNINAGLIKKVESLTNDQQRKDADIKKIRTSLDSLNRMVHNSLILSQVKTAKYAGEYEFGFENGPQGTLKVFAEANGLYYFSLEYIVGPPGFNMAMLAGTMKIYGNTGVFTANLSSDEENQEQSPPCKVVFIFDNDGVFIRQMTSDIYCGFGNNVFVTEYFSKTSTQNAKIDFSDFELIESTNDWR